MQTRAVPAIETVILNEVTEKPTRRALEALVRKLRRKHLNFDHLNCSGCIARERRRYAKEKPITVIEDSLVEHGDSNLIRLAFPALVPLIQQHLEMTNIDEDNPDF